ncbi:hypothetical protein ACM39_18670 [Chryseobacterium sp. FH2]|uniref:helix-turn-helix domain-containing protein n=1 Tax=Chryseobacterium sp. FH2 TaxID=1674291 RepID=UPI00065AC022|nr:helix-turn-helix domain-containing protein [Chryseobacterium sp. FH2]KMQ58347.1 hypothetical protein ACM39_18670 [Chryseobacterium sp. FH2]
MKLQYLLILFSVLAFPLKFKGQIPDSYQKKLERHLAEIKTHPQAAQKELLALIDQAEKKKLHLVSIRAYEGIAYHYSATGDTQNTLKYAKNAAELAEKYGYKSETAAMLGLVGQQYGLVGLNDLAKENIQKGINAVRKPAGDIEKTHLGNLYSYLMYVKENSKDSIQIYLDYAKKALSAYLEIKNKGNRDKYSVVGYGNLGMCYREAGKKDSALWTFDKLLAINKGKNAYMAGNAFLNKGQLFLEINQLDSAEISLQKAEKLFSGNNFLNEEKDLYSAFITLYQAKNDKNKLKEYKSAYLELENQQQKSRLDTATELLKNENKEKKSITSYFYKAVIGLGIVIIALLIIVTMQRKKHLRERAAFEAFRKNRASEEKYSGETETTENAEEPKSENLSEETEIRLLKGLETFEKECRYNERGITLGKIATQLNTNTKYLSLVIKKHKSDNFSRYINTLRINYMVDKIENAPEYRKYKVSYLAEETGFSSANAFSKVFKDITGVSPSSYITLLEKENQ